MEISFLAIVVCLQGNRLISLIHDDVQALVGLQAQHRVVQLHAQFLSSFVEVNNFCYIKAEVICTNAHFERLWEIERWYQYIQRILQWVLGK